MGVDKLKMYARLLATGEQCVGKMGCKLRPTQHFTSVTFYKSVYDLGSCRDDFCLFIPFLIFGFLDFYRLS